MATPNYAPHYFITGLSQGLLQAMERRLQREEDERRFQRQLELERSRSQPVDILPLLPQEIRERAYPDRQEPLLMPPNVVPGLTSQLLSVYGRQPEQPAALPAEFLTDWLTAAQTGDTSALQRWAGTNVPVQALSGLGTFVSRVATTPSQIELTEARIEETRAGAELTRAQAQAQELQNRLNEIYAEPERRARLDQILQETARTRAQTKLTEAQLDRYLQETGAVVAKALAEARIAEARAEITEETKNAAIQRAYAELDELLAQNQITWLDYYLQRELVPIQIEMALEGLQQQRLETRRKEIETQLLEEFGRAERAAALEGLQLQNIARQIGIELDKEELEFLRETMGPRVAKVVAEAAAAELDLQMSQETFELTVQRLQEELNKLRIENKISEQQYEQAVQMAPYLIQEAQLRLLQRQYENERLQLENEYARQSFETRLRQLDLQSQQLQVEITRTQTQIEMLNQQIAMAKRTDPLRVQQLEAELELTREKLNQLRIENSRLENQSSALRGLSADDREFARKLYETEIAPFKGRGVWIPSYADYVDNLLSDQPLDWNQYVMLYDQEMRSKIGPPPSDDSSYEWLQSEWQSAYRSARDAYYGQFPDFERAYSQIPEYPPIQVWHAWINSPEISRLDPLSDEFRQEHVRFVEWWNGQLQGGGGQADQTTPGASSGTNDGILDRVLRALRFNPTEEANELLNVYGDQALAVLEANEQGLLDSGYTQDQLNRIKNVLRERLGVQEQSSGRLDLNRLREQAIDYIGAILNSPGDILLNPFGLRVSRDPAVAEENVRRGNIGIALLSLLLGARAVTGPTSTGIGGAQAGRGVTGTFRGPITETPAPGALPGPNAQLPPGGVVAPTFGDEVLQGLAGRLLAQFNGDINAIIDVIHRNEALLRSAGVNVQRLIALVQGGL